MVAIPSQPVNSILELKNSFGAPINFESYTLTESDDLQFMVDRALAYIQAGDSSIALEFLIPDPDGHSAYDQIISFGPALVPTQSNEPDFEMTIIPNGRQTAKICPITSDSKSETGMRNFILENARQQIETLAQIPADYQADPQTLKLLAAAPETSISSRKAA
ncbi:MAG: hypothetical protein OXU45_03620 [Candidatus Melainabacteria bacterium]|nr:hypothetical protein [Candidatus Melainabacteria bacterium]